MYLFLYSAGSAGRLDNYVPARYLISRHAGPKQYRENISMHRPITNDTTDLRCQFGSIIIITRNALRILIWLLLMQKRPAVCQCLPHCSLLTCLSNTMLVLVTWGAKRKAVHSSEVIVGLSDMINSRCSPNMSLAIKLACMAFTTELHLHVWMFCFVFRMHAAGRVKASGRPSSAQDLIISHEGSTSCACLCVCCFHWLSLNLWDHISTTAW